MTAPSIDAVRAALGLEPLTASGLSPEELSEKAKQQARNSEGQFVEEVAVKATLPEPEEATPPPPPEPEVQALTGQEAVDALIAAGYSASEARGLSDHRVYTRDGRSFTVAPTPKSKAATPLAKARDKARTARRHADEYGDIYPEYPRQAEEAQAKLDVAQRKFDRASSNPSRKDDAMAREALDFLEKAVGKLSSRSATRANGEQRPFVAVTDWGRSGKRNASGAAYQGSDTMWLNPAYFDTPRDYDTDRSSITPEFVKSGEYTINHELGHMIDVVDISRDTVLEKMHVSRSNGQVWVNAKDRGEMSRYGRTNTAEGYAEVFTAWQAGIRTESVREYARQFGWGEPEVATPPPPESETVPVGELLPDDAITHDGQAITVDEVVTNGDTVTVRGTGADGGEVEFDLPVDGSVTLGGEAEALPDIPSLADLGLERAQERRLRTFMKGRSITLNEAQAEELGTLRKSAYQRIGQHYGWSQDETDEAVAREDALIKAWTQRGPTASSLAPEYAAMFAAVQSLRDGNAPTTVDERAVTLMRDYAQMTLAERGESSVELLRMVYGPQGIYLRGAPEGTRVEVESHPLSSWSSERGLPSLRTWLGGMEDPALLRTEVPAKQVWMAFYSDERFRSQDVKGKAEFIIDDGEGFSTDNGLTFESVQSSAPLSYNTGRVARKASKVRERFPDLTMAEMALALTEGASDARMPTVGDEKRESLGGVDEELIATHIELLKLVDQHDLDRTPIVWAARDAGVDPVRLRKFLGEARIYHMNVGGDDVSEYWGNRIKTAQRHAHELLAEDPAMVERFKESLAKVRQVQVGRLGKVTLYPGERALQYGPRYTEVEDADGNVRLRLLRGDYELPAWQDTPGDKEDYPAEELGAEEATPPPPPEPETEEATPPPPETSAAEETILAGDLLVDDVISLDGQQYTVETVEQQGDRARIFGRTGDGPSGLIADLPVDEPVALAGGELAPEPEAEWLVAYRAARSRLPEDMTLFGMDTAPNPLLPRMRELIAEQQGIRDAYASGDRSEDTESDVRRLLRLSPDEAIPDDAVDQLDEFITSLTEMETSMAESRGQVDLGAGTETGFTPGPIVQQHLEALLEMGAILDAELERRIEAVLPAASRSAEEAQAALEDARTRYYAAHTAREEMVRAKREEVLAAEWPGMVAENPRRRAFGSADEVVAIAQGVRRTTPARTAVAADLYQRMEAAIAADEELTANQQTLDDTGTEIGRLDDEAQEARGAAHYGDPRGRHGTKAYAAAQREQAIALIAELREVGGSARITMRVREQQQGAVRDSLKATFESLPTEWLSDIEAQNIRIVLGRRGHYRKNGADDRPEVMLSDDNPGSLLPLYGRVTTHELGHAVEDSRPHIRTAEWAFSHLRAPRDETEVETIRADEVGHRDDWADIYTGRVYADSHYLAWEIMTTGLESLLADSNYFLRQAEAGGFDRQFRAFILALLAEA